MSCASAKTSCSSGKVYYADETACALLANRLDKLTGPAEDAWQVVKRNSSRTVYRGAIDGQEIYVKHFHPHSSLDRLVALLGPSRARRELRASQYLRSQGVETAPALAAMCRANGVEWYATRAVQRAHQGDLWHTGQLTRGPEGAKAIQQAIVRLAEMVARMHAAGVIHCDLHCGNVLVSDAPDGPRVILTDLHRIKRRKRLSRRSMAANLAQLFHDRLDFTTRTERLRFLRRYLQTGGARGSLRGWAAMIEDLAYGHRQRQYSIRDRRIAGDNRYFCRLSLGRGWRGHAVLASKRHMADSKAAKIEFRPRDWQEVLAHPEQLLDPRAGEVIKESPSSLVIRRRLAVGGRELDVFVKQTRRKHPWKIVLDCFRNARPIRAFRLGHQLLTRRIATALPLAALERRVGPFLLDCILITEAVDALPMNQFLKTWLGLPPAASLDSGQKRLLAQDVLRQLGRLLQRLHDNNFAHRDLKGSNLLIRWTGDGQSEVVLVDLDGLRHGRYISTRRRFQGLMRLNVSLLECPVVSHAGQLRMLLGYLRRPGSGRIHFKPYWRVLEAWSARKLAQQIRSRRKRQKAARRPAP